MPMSERLCSKRDDRDPLFNPHGTSHGHTAWIRNRPTIVKNRYEAAATSKLA
jgi:hypothetical protein